MSIPDTWEVAAIIAKLMLYIGFAGSTGLVMVRIAFSTLVAPLGDRMRMQSVYLAALALGASVVGFMLRGAALTGGADGMIDPEMLGLLWTTPVGDALICRIIGAAMIIWGEFISRVGKWVALVGGIVAFWSFTNIGHVPDLGQSGIRLLLLLHLLGVAFWVGILGPLRNLSQQSEHLDNAALLGHRFGQVAAAIVPVLILAGILMAWLLLGDLETLGSTVYGQTLLAKVVLVGVVLALAAINKLRIVPAMQDGDATVAKRLVRSIEIETAVILAVLAATATLTSVMTLPN
ncbi:copper resistance D family protein [Shimia litoralis]|uniref:copper resistance D family protein n=1 Tax=Shimia litoralis TaxID=420403 RepID=UPI001FE3FAB7|nr:CopD family protein [Shimia litoralis]